MNLYKATVDTKERRRTIYVAANTFNEALEKLNDFHHGFEFFEIQSLQFVSFLI